MRLIHSLFVILLACTFLLTGIDASPLKVEGKMLAMRSSKDIPTRKACDQIVTFFKKKFKNSCPGQLVGESNTKTTRLDFLLCRCHKNSCILRYTADCQDDREEIAGTSITITRDMRMPVLIR
ncbi:MAG: hypothetical protein AAF518_09420 [Spirochaetota bacterium]